MDNREIIRLREVSFGYARENRVLEGVNLTIRAGERVGLVGPIGSGKTTLLHLIVGLLKPQAGTVEIFDRPRAVEKDFWDVRERVGLLFQDPEDQLFSPTVREDIAFGPLNQGRSGEETERIVEETLDVLDLRGFEDRITHHLSGGEKRLVSLATVLAMKPDVLLLDEPVNGLDGAMSGRIQDLLLSLPQAMIVVSHDAGFLGSVCTRVWRSRKGEFANGRKGEWAEGRDGDGPASAGIVCLQTRFPQRPPRIRTRGRRLGTGRQGKRKKAVRGPPPPLRTQHSEPRTQNSLRLSAGSRPSSVPRSPTSHSGPSGRPRRS